MTPAAKRIQDRAELTEIITATCKRRHDSEEHRRACINETLKQPAEDRAYWVDYWTKANPKTWDIEAVKAGVHP